MNEIVNEFLLAGDRFMPEMHLKQPGFTYSAWGPFTKNKKRNQKVQEAWDTNYIYKNEIDKACFQHYMAYGDFKDLATRTASDKGLRDKVFNIAKSLKYDGYQRGLAYALHEYLGKRFVGSGVNTLAENEIKQNHQSAEELHKPIIKKFQKRTIYSGFKDNIWVADLADTQLISKDLDFYYGLLIFLVSMLGLFL